MREEIKLLIQLQELDATIRNLSRTKEKLSKDAADADQAAQAERRALESTTASSKEFRRALDKREGDLKDVEGRIHKLETQLNSVKSNKEYAALHHEILGLRADKSRVEDDILKMLEQVETQQKDLKVRGSKTDAVESATRERRKAIETGLQDADARIDRIRQEREVLAAKIPPAFLTPYERLLTRSDGRAMVACRNFVCDGCRMSLTTNTVSLLMGGDKLVFCHSCGRILFLAEGEDLTGVAAAGRRDSW